MRVAALDREDTEALIIIGTQCDYIGLRCVLLHEGVHDGACTHGEHDVTHCTICGDPISGVDQADEAWCAECFERNLAQTLEPGQGLGWRPAARHWPQAAEGG